MVLRSRRHGRIAVVRFVLLAFHRPARVRRLALPCASPMVEQLEVSALLRSSHRVARRDSRRGSSKPSRDQTEGEDMTHSRCTQGVPHHAVSRFGSLFSGTHA
jgi:hypothetical protein